MKKLMALVVIATAIAVHGSVTITGHVKVGDTTAPATNVSKIRMQLMYCVQQGQNTPRVIGTGALISPQFDIVPSSDGSYSFTSYGNDVITCDTAGNSRWRVIMIYKNGQQSYNEYQVPDGGTFNLDTASTSSSGATAYTPTAVLTNPAGAQTITQPNSGTPLNVNFLNCTGTCTGFSSSFTLNGLSGSTQTFATDALGSDFGVASLGSTHTWSLPTASATKRGALSSADWSAFNAKQAAIAGNTLGANIFATSINSAGTISGVQPAVANLSDAKTGTLGSLVLSNGPTITKITVNQDANGNDLFFGQRFTDTSPTGNLIYFKNAANNADLFKLDVAGVMTHSNNVLFATDNTFDIGASAANRPRSIYFGTQLLAPIGSVGTPSISFSGATNTGFYMTGSQVGISSAGADGLRINSTTVTAASTGCYAWGIGGADTFICRDGAANTVAMKNANNDQKYRLYGANADFSEYGVASELITLSTVGATTDSVANLLPANSIIGPVDCRVTTTITTATNWSVGDATIAARFSPANSTLTAGTTSVGITHVDQTGTSGPKQTAAAKLRITTTGTPGAGVIRCSVHYTLGSAPTS